MSVILVIGCTIAFMINSTVDALDSAAFHRIFNDSSLTDQQIDQLAQKYNKGVENGRGKEAGISFLKSRRGLKKQKSIIDKFINLWQNDLMLRKIYGDMIESIENDITGDLKEKINKWKQEADEEHGGDFGKSQLQIVRKIVNEVPPEQKEAIRNKLNQPLKSYKTEKKLEKLLTALYTFQT